VQSSGLFERNKPLDFFISSHLSGFETHFSYTCSRSPPLGFMSMAMRTPGSGSDTEDQLQFAVYSGEVFGCSACCSLSFTSRNCLNLAISFAASSLFPMRR
jgi:hypothetical protein